MEKLRLSILGHVVLIKNIDHLIIKIHPNRPNNLPQPLIKKPTENNPTQISITNVPIPYILVKSTKGYHLEHSEIPASIINKYNLVESFQQHKLTDMYSFGVIFEKLIPMQELKKNSVFDDFRDFVDLFIRKCKDFNPDDRY